MIDCLPIGVDLLDGGAREQSAFGSAVHRSNGLVVGVKQEGVLFVVPVVVGGAWFEDKLLVEPCRVCEVPFQWADFGHRLDDQVFGFESFAEVIARGSRSHIMREDAGTI